MSETAFTPYALALLDVARLTDADPAMVLPDDHPAILIPDVRFDQTERSLIADGYICLVGVRLGLTDKGRAALAAVALTSEAA